jgi:hypothetical protein
MLVLVFGHAFPVAPTVPGFVVATVVNLGLAGVGFSLLRAQHFAHIRGRRAA